MEKELRIIKEIKSCIKVHATTMYTLIISSISTIICWFLHQILIHFTSGFNLTIDQIGEMAVNCRDIKG